MHHFPPCALYSTCFSIWSWHLDNLFFLTASVNHFITKASTSESSRIFLHAGLPWQIPRKKILVVQKLVVATQWMLGQVFVSCSKTSGAFRKMVVMAKPNNILVWLGSRFVLKTSKFKDIQKNPDFLGHFFQKYDLNFDYAVSQKVKPGEA